MTDITGSPSGSATERGPQRANRRGEATRARLLTAALAAFSSRGFHATGTREIAAEAGVAPSALYTHYPSKEDLLFALSAQGHGEISRLVEAVADGPGSPTDKLRRTVERYVAWHARCHTQARVVQYEMDALSADHNAVIAELRRGVERTMRSLVTEGIDAGEFGCGDAKVAGLAILSLGIDVARWYREGGTRTPEQLGTAYADIALDIVRARERDDSCRRSGSAG